MLLYRLECLPLTSTLQDKLHSAFRRILRYALEVHFPDCMSNAELTRRTGATAMSKTLRQRRLRLVGHALRMANPSPQYNTSPLSSARTSEAPWTSTNIALCTKTLLMTFLQSINLWNLWHLFLSCSSKPVYFHCPHDSSTSSSISSSARFPCYISPHIAMFSLVHCLFLSSKNTSPSTICFRPTDVTVLQLPHLHCRRGLSHVLHPFSSHVSSYSTPSLYGTCNLISIQTLHLPTIQHCWHSN